MYFSVLILVQLHRFPFLITQIQCLLLPLLIILLLDRPLCPDGMLIVGWWSSSPRTEAKETIDSIPIELRFYSRPVVVATLLFPT